MLQTFVCTLYAILLSQPNNNHNPNNKTTITVVGLRQSNRWEHHLPTTTTHHRNSKLHDRVEIEQTQKTKVISLYEETPKQFLTLPQPQNQPIRAPRSQK